ncbi:SRPBCC family protein [Actinokineospora auranticolor]|uniref:Polyketide cyclase/dehydrase/lipid transport protein n=1 Tax=Actinokineospora auranticolor TaxID=155976 RepID=A0A2S6GTK7_9PSEU|nr:SRPBCC family protein [Actinokineospora auranticolor]PPK68582.1 polyketide cyclase/dehydrase/lipid transport protein [Actinokineospora auranticolor]
MSNTRRRAALAAIPLAACVLAGLVTPARAAPAQTSVSCQGQGVDRTAKVRYRTERLVKAPLSVVWKLQTDVERWPSWQEPVTTMERLDPGPLRAGSRFRWTTPVPATPVTPETTLTITSSVAQIRDRRCVRWTGPAIGVGLRIDRGVHVWTFTQVPGGVLVRTEETHAGAQIESDVPLATEFLGKGLEAWLDALKVTAEARCR